MKTIIDNNIFYGIYLNEIDINQVKVKNPIANNLNLDEFLRSYNFIYNTKTVKGALKSAMRLCEKKLITKNPYMYILQLDGIESSLTQHDEELINWTNKLASDNYELPKENVDEIIKNWIEPRVIELEEIAKVYNEWFLNLRTLNKVEKKKIRILDIIEDIKELLKESINNWTNFHLEKNIVISSSFDWNQLDLFLNAFAAFFKSNLLGEGKFKPHDSFDLFQLVYVQPGDKYWTKEKKWQNIIFEKAKKSEYLFEYKGEYLHSNSITG